MDKILVSACLMGEPVRFDGGDKFIDHPLIRQWHDEGRLVSICPEIAGGFSTPRLPAEIADGLSGPDVIDGKGRIIDRSGADVTGLFLQGAHIGLDIAKQYDCNYALLMEGSPSCGSTNIYDGSFTGNQITGIGVFAALLIQHDIMVFNQNQLAELASHLDKNYAG